MFSLTTEYALRAALDLAAHPGNPQSAKAIAEATRAPASYVARVLQILAREGLVTSRRGRTGGYHLARPADQITLLDIVNAIDPIHRFEDDPLKVAETRARLRSLHVKLDEIAGSAVAQLRAVTLADLAP
jgi:Rrf2 family transcriptional regulator, nitric oxide-sensitive transcriptional repressor